MWFGGARFQFYFRGFFAGTLPLLSPCPPPQLGQISSTVLEQVDQGGQHGNAARTRIRDETSETDHTQKRRFRHGAICRTIKALAILRCLHGSEMVLLGVIIRKCETPTTNISQESGHGILRITCQFVAYN